MKRFADGVKGKVFYGWWIVLSCATITFYGAGSFFYGFGAFFNPIINEFGWTRAATAFAFSLQRIEGGIAAPIVGLLVDRLGPRKLILFGVLVAGCGFLLMSRINSLPTFYGAFIVVSIGFSTSLGSVGMVAVANWFVRKRGRAMGFMMAGAGASGLLVPILIWLIGQYGWRTTLVIAGVGMWAIGLPLSLVVRHKPEQYGYLPDGDKYSQKDESPLGLEASYTERKREGDASHTTFVTEEGVVLFGDYGLTLKEALKTQAFWVISVGFSISSMATGGIFVHQIPYLISLGFSPTTAAFVTTFMTLGSIVGRLGFGWLADIHDKRYVLAVAFGIQAVGVVIFALTRTFWHLIPFLLVFGPAYGGPIPVRPALQGDYFGVKAFGAIQGFMQAVMTLGGVVGPVFAGWVFDVTGSYRVAFLLFAATTLVGVPFILAAKRPMIPEGAAPVAVPSARQSL